MLTEDTSPNDIEDSGHMFKGKVAARELVLSVDSGELGWRMMHKRSIVWR